MKFAYCSTRVVSCTRLAHNAKMSCFLFSDKQKALGGHIEYKGKDLTFSPSIRGMPKMQMDGYIYLRETAKANKTYWVCERARKFKCRARAITTKGSGKVTINDQEHNHMPDV